MRRSENIDTRLRDKGLRATAQRLMICKEIDKAGHIDIDTLYEKLKKQIPSLSLATIYKNMHSLVGKDIISEVSVGGKKTLYELTADNHIHHVCTECGAIEDIPSNTVEILKDVKALSGKSISDCSITTYGICDSCAAK